MTPAFFLAFTRTVGTEGGLVDNPNDPGGATKYGISSRAYPYVDVPNLTLAQAQQIYFDHVWTPLQLDQLPELLAFQVFDAAVNDGNTGAVEILQKALGVAVDGDLGPQTLAAIASHPPAALVMLFVAATLDHWRSLGTWASFGNGWTGRGATNLRYAAADLVAS